MTLHQASQQLLFQLFHLYDEREARNIADLVMENVTEWKRIDRLLNKEVPLSYQKEELLARYTAQLLEHRPVQYVLNEAWFDGKRFYVDENVLIPRPETEELVDWVVKEQARTTASAASLLDIGTGSGCIAISLKKRLPRSSVYACDVSQPALDVAQKNAAINHTLVDFLLCDFLLEDERARLPRVDIIVSNPPYVPLQDKEEMQLNVLKHEPHLALFVADSDPLIFYKMMAAFCDSNLTAEGSIFVEIHEHLGKGVTGIFQSAGFTNTELRKDLQGRDRMVKASR